MAADSIILDESRINFYSVKPCIFTAFSPLGGPRCPHKKKKKKPCIFTAGGAKVPTQEQKKPWRVCHLIVSPKIIEIIQKT